MSNNKPTYYQQFSELQNGKLFYIHMAIIAFMVTEFRNSSLDLYSALIQLFALACMVYGFIKSMGFNAKIDQLEYEAREKGLLKLSVSRSDKKLSLRQFLKVFPVEQSIHAESIIGILLFSYYLYSTQAIPLADLSSWLWFIGLVSLFIVLLIIWASLPYQSPSPYLTQISRISKFLFPIVIFLNLVGRLPIVAIVIHIFSRMAMETDFNIGDSVFQEDYHFYTLLYLALMNSSAFDRLRYRSIKE